MKVWSSITQSQQELSKDSLATVVTIGNFDGVHRGHQAIIDRTVRLAKFQNLTSLAVTFINHTESLLHKAPPLINLPAIRRERLATQGLDALLELQFDQQLSETQPEEFFDLYLVKALRARLIVVGYDFRFGSNGRGDFTLLQSLGTQYGVAIERVEPVQIGGVTASSSKIRQYLLDGQLELANQMLGYDFYIESQVIPGEQRGRTIGFPTANLMIGKEFILPRYGVYCVRLTAGDQMYHGIANVGIKPTFGGEIPLVEVFLFDVSLNLYGNHVKVDFLRFIRSEARFSGLEELKEQIAKDIIVAKNFFND